MWAWQNVPEGICLMGVIVRSVYHCSRQTLHSVHNCILMTCRL